jgi:hypothetical protein
MTKAELWTGAGGKMTCKWVEGTVQADDITIQYQDNSRDGKDIMET